MTSQENVGLVRRGVEAWNRKDAETWLTLLSEDIEWEPIGPAAVERAVYRGRGEVLRAFSDVWEEWKVFRFEEAEIRDLGSRVMWLGRVKMTGAASHVELDQEFAVDFLLAADEITRIKAFPTWQEAIDATGAG